MPKYLVLYLKYAPYILSFLVALVLGPLLYCLSFYIHEFGHIAYGFFDYLISTGKIADIGISNWINCSFLPVLKIPQQTRTVDDYASLSFALGGIIMTLLFFSVFSYYYFKKSKNPNKKAVFLIPLIFALNEIFGNFLCGTDNLFGKPYPICQTIPIIDFIIKPIPFLLIIPFFILLIPHFKNLIKKMFEIIEKRKTKS